MKQIICQRSITSPTNTNWTGFAGHFGVRSAESQAETSWSTAGTFRKLRIRLGAAPGSGKSWTITVRKNGADTSMVVTIADTATEGEDLTNTVSVSPGDRLALKWTATNTPAASVSCSLAVEFESTNTGESGYAQEVGPLSSTTARKSGAFWATYTSTSFDTWNQANTAAEVANIVPLDGAITGLYARLNASPGGGSKGYEFAIYKALAATPTTFVKQDGTGGTVDTRVTCSGTTQDGSATFTLDIAPGDRVYVEVTPLNSPNAVRGAVSTRVLADTDGQSIVGGWLTTTLDNTNTDNFTTLSGARYAYVSTESDRHNISHPSAFSLSGLRVGISVAPGSGKSWTFTARKNSATPSSGPEVVLSDSETTGVDASHSMSINDGDTFGLKILSSTGSPTSPYGTWSLIQSDVSTLIRGSFVAGVNTTVTASNAAAFGLDGATNVHSEEGVHKVFGAASVTEYLELEEMTAPTGVANKARLYAVDNGAGKTQIVVIFGSGAAQVIATEP